MQEQAYKKKYTTLGDTRFNPRYIGLWATLVCNFIILLGNPLRNGRIISWGMRVLVTFIFLLAVFEIIQAFRKRRVTYLEFLYLALIALTITSGLFDGWRFLLLHAVKYMCFLMLPAYFIAYKDVDRLGDVRRAIYAANIAYTGIFIYFYFSPQAHTFYTALGSAEVDDLTLGYNNPNETAIYLLCAFIIMWSAMRNAQEKGRQSLLYLALCGVLYYFILETHCRAGVILVPIFVLLDVIRPMQRIGKNLLMFATALPAISAVLAIIFPVFFQQWILLGESADTGRYLIYRSFLNHLDLRVFLFGDYSLYAGANFHNSYMTIFGTFGFVSMLIYVIFLYQSMRHYSGRVEDRASYAAYMGAITLILHGTAEGTLLVSGTVYAGLFGLIVVLMIPEEIEKPDEEEKPQEEEITERTAEKETEAESIEDSATSPWETI